MNLPAGITRHDDVEPNRPVFLTAEGIRIPGVTRLLREVGAVQHFDVDDLWYYLDRGKAAHLACALHGRDALEIETLDWRLLPYVKAYHDLVQTTGFVPLHDLGEFCCVEEQGRWQVYVDQPGFIPKIGATIVELKTGTLHPTEAKLQTIAQKIAFVDQLRRDGHPLANEQWTRHAFHLRNNAKGRLIAYDDDEIDRRKFLGHVREWWGRVAEHGTATRSVDTAQVYRPGSQAAAGRDVGSDRARRHRTKAARSHGRRV